MTALSRVPAVLLVVVALAGSACTAASGAALDGREFLSASVTDGGVDRPLVAGTQIRLTFGPGTLGAQAGCNQIGGSYRLDGGRLIFEGAGMTEMGCDPARHAQDDWLVAFLAAGPSVQLTTDALVLSAGTTTIRLVDRRVADPDRPLVGPTWVLVAIIGPGGADGAVSSIPEGIVASLRFGDDGTVEVETGCNMGSGRWALDGWGIRFSEIGLTKRACLEGAGQVEGAVMTVLGVGTVEATIQADQLVIRGGGQGLQFEGR
jgi:heat shock protein HslJ